MIPRRSALLLVLALASCSGEPAQSAPTGDVGESPDSVPIESGRFFERTIVFLATRPDSVLIVPWLISARTLPGGVQREVRGLLARGDTWEEFFTDQWESLPTRLPWNPLPRGRMRLVVGDLDALEQILFDEGPRQLSVQLLQPRAEWSGPRGESFRLLDGALMMASARVPGLILDVMRARPLRDGQGGDWAVLYSGDSLQVVLHSPDVQPPGTAGAFQALARVNEVEQTWPDVSVNWSERTSFERARREIPAVWSAEAAGGDMSAELTIQAAQIQAGQGDGPQLPVDAFFQVEGTVRIAEAVYRVSGLLRHTQP